MHEELLATPVGELARRKFVAVRPDQTLDEALHDVRASAPKHRVIYFYVTEPDGRLVGVLPTRRLLLAEPSAKIASLMLDRFIAVPHDLPLLEACEFFILHRLLALPVVDDGGKLVGVVDVDQFAEGLTELSEASGEGAGGRDTHGGELTEPKSDELFQLIGLRLAEVRGTSVAAQVKGRFLWLLCNVAGGLAAAVVVSLFQPTLDRAIALAMFIPVVLALAESVSIQSLTLALRETRAAAIGKIVRNELPVGLLLGLLCGGCLAVVAGLWTGSGRIALTLLLALLVSLVWAALLGRLIPAVIGRRGRDPKVASGPIVLTLTDLGTLAMYLTLATVFIR